MSYSNLNIIQDTLKVSDTAKVVKAHKLTPSKKIENDEGALIPKEVTEWIEIQPAIPKKEESSWPTYAIAGVFILLIILGLRFYFRRRNKPE